MRTVLQLYGFSGSSDFHDTNFLVSSEEDAPGLSSPARLSAASSWYRDLASSSSILLTICRRRLSPLMMPEI